ncbi:integrase catalytic domain-containing protein [Trichonephila clavipes]|nr:integrase catalytic domain-containing protein [Trichonephila clavipes]
MELHQQLALNEANNFPLASKAAHNDFYVDDLMSGANSLSEALELQNQLTQMLSSAGLVLRKWASNCKELLNSIDSDMRLSNASLNVDNDDTVKPLGILWHPASNVFYFKITSLSFEGPKEHYFLQFLRLSIHLDGCHPSQSSIKKSCKDCGNNSCIETKGFLQTLHLNGNNLLRMCNWSKTSRFHDSCSSIQTTNFIYLASVMLPKRLMQLQFTVALFQIQEKSTFN